jgi:HSP20 family protein
MEKLVEKAFSMSPVQLSGSADFVPSLDLNETEKEILVRIEVPGMNEKDIDISLSKDMLTISGEKKEELEENDKGIYRSERRFGSFSRSIRLPENLIDSEKVEASYRDGVLSVRLPKLAEFKETVKKISIGAEKPNANFDSKDSVENFENN